MDISLCKYLTYKEWKQLESLAQAWLELGKYLTYKEWKHVDGVWCQVNNSSHVSTLPIRNGNLRLSFLRSCRLGCKYLTYKEWKRKDAGLRSFICCCTVSTLPIRNGNIVCGVRFIILDIIVLSVSTLPIRNGNMQL